jgi:DNA-binding MarR family transcriptional regulator
VPPVAPKIVSRMDHVEREPADGEGGPPPAAITPALAHYTGYLLRRAFARARDSAQRLLPPGTHPGEGAILLNLAQLGPASQQELSDRLRVNRTIMVKLVDKLESDGLVQRERNPRDRRSYALTVTPEGQQAVQAWERTLEHGDSELVAPLDPGERRRLHQLLLQLVADLTTVAPRSLTDRSGFLLSHAHFRLRERGDRALAPLGVEPRGFAALAVLDLDGPSPQRRVARQLGVSGPTMVQTMDELERAGLVERQRNPSDRREYALRLTVAGRERLRQARQALDAVQAEVTAQLGEADDGELRALLAKLVMAPPAQATRAARPRRGPAATGAGGPARP